MAGFLSRIFGGGAGASIAAAGADSRHRRQLAFPTGTADRRSAGSVAGKPVGGALRGYLSAPRKSRKPCGGPAGGTVFRSGQPASRHAARAGDGLAGLGGDPGARGCAVAGRDRRQPGRREPAERLYLPARPVRSRLGSGGASPADPHRNRAARAGRLHTNSRPSRPAPSYWRSTSRSGARVC